MDFPSNSHTQDSKTSIYARTFDENNSNWHNEPAYNLLYLRAQQNYLNQALQVRGHVFLNEVYDALGFPRSSAGAVVGWIQGNGDDYIDFGFTDPHPTDEGGISLDFNVDGVIYDKIEELTTVKINLYLEES